MSQKTLIDGKEREITHGRTLIDGKEREITHGRTLIDGKEREIFFGLRLRKLPVGTPIVLNVDGAETNFIIVNQGNPDSSLYDESCDGTWLMSEDLQATTANANGEVFGNDSNYKSSNAHTVFAPAFFARLDPKVQSVVKEVKIPYVNGAGNVGSVASGSNGLTTRIFLLSKVEVGGSTVVSGGDDDVFGDGKKLDWFYEGNSSAQNARRVAKYRGNAAYWWLRTPESNRSSNVSGAVDQAGRADTGLTSSATGIGSYKSYYRPVMILPGSLRVESVGSNAYTLKL